MSPNAPLAKGKNTLFQQPELKERIKLTSFERTGRLADR